MKNKKCYLWIICLVCAALCIGSVIGSCKLYNYYISENSFITSAVQLTDDDMSIKNYNLNVKIYHIYIFSAIATLFTALVALIIAFITPKIEKRNNICSFKISMTDNFPYFNSTNLDFYDFDENGIYQGTTSCTGSYIYRIGITPINNPSKDTIVAVKHFRQSGQSDDVLGFLPMRLKWSYKDNVQNPNDIVIEKKLYPEIEHYCDFCFVKKSPNSKDWFLSLCGEYSGQTGKSICNCIFNQGLYEVDITVASDNSDMYNNYRISFVFYSAAKLTNRHPSMFVFKDIKKI